MMSPPKKANGVLNAIKHKRNHPVINKQLLLNHVLQEQNLALAM
jgi:hypothetical protein